METKKEKGLEVTCQHPFTSNSNLPMGKQRSVIVYPFNEETIKKIVPDDIVCGNYMLGELDKDNIVIITGFQGVDEECDITTLR